MLCCCVPVLFSVFVVSVIVKWLKQKKNTEKDKKKQPWMCQTVVVASALQSTHL